MIIRDGPCSCEIREESRLDVGSQVFHVDAGDVVVASIDQRVATFRETDLDTSTRTVDGRGPKDQGRPASF
jgi:hypothetical protein